MDQWQETNKDAEDVPVLSLEISTIKAEYRKQTWDDVATVTVAKLSILNHLVDGRSLWYCVNGVCVDDTFLKAPLKLYL